MYNQYVLGTVFEKRLFDAYIGASNQKRPPYLDALFSEVLQMEAKIILDTELKDVMEPTEWHHMNKEVWENNSTVQLDVLKTKYREDSGQILADVFIYLTTRKISYLERDDMYDRYQKATWVHAPVVATW